MVWLAVTAALLGAFFLAVGTQRQASAVQASTGGLQLSPHGLLRMARNPRWALGLTLQAVGMALNVFALVSAPLTVVQPIGAIALVITTLVNSKDQGIRLNRMTVVSVSACMVGSAAFVLLAVTVTAHNQSVTAEGELSVVLLLAVVVAVFMALEMTFRHRLNAFAYILGAGMLFGFVAVLVRIIGLHLLDPNGRFIANVPIYTVLAIAAAAGLGAWFVQSAYASGPPDLVIAGLTVIDPLVGISIGIFILGELQPNVRPAAAIAMVGAGLVAIVGVIALSRHHPDVLQKQEEARRRARAAGK
ncbi:DMT family transporter [Arthrobacter sp. GCM10027362]|uniref:DMT family transporter n=1 Tax=Arthrobacter sp. GCM10027362 TaxID=3273379 RepID=UPI0036289B70